MSTTTHSHIVPMAHPLFFILRIIQLVLAVVLLGLLAYLAWDYNQIAGTFTSTYSGAVGVGLFTVCLTIILGVYYFVSTTAVPNAYNRWAVIALEAAAALFWLITFALLADCVALNAAEEAAASVSYTYCDVYGYCYKRLGKRGIYDTWNGLWDASLAFAVIEWILFMVTLVLFALGLHKHRTATNNANANSTELGYTPKHMEAGQAPAQPVPAPEYHQEQHVPQPGFEQQPMQQHPVQDSTPMH